MNEIQYREISFQDKQLIKGVQKIYETSFRGEVRVPWDYLLCEFEGARIRDKLKRWKNERYHLFGGLEEDKLVAFFISKYFFEFSYSTYMAVDLSYRNRDIGTQMGWKLIEIAKADADEFQIKDSVLLFEVEKPEYASNDSVKVELEERIQFYKTKFEAIYLDIQYIQPLPMEDGIEMYLAMVPLSNKNFIESDRLLNYIKIIYELEYHLTPQKNASKLGRNMKIIRDSIKNRKKIFGIANL